MRYPVRFGILAVSLALSGCHGPGFRLRGDSNARVHVVYDSPIIEDLADQAVRSREEAAKELGSREDIGTRLSVWHQSGRFLSERGERIGKEPGFDVPGRTAITILRESDTLRYSKVRFDDGPFKGKVGWVSRGLIDDPRTRMP
jgi:hypothetical protein